jgi:hypothetical protein
MRLLKISVVSSQRCHISSHNTEQNWRKPNSELNSLNKLKLNVQNNSLINSMVQSPSSEAIRRLAVQEIPSIL